MLQAQNLFCSFTQQCRFKQWLIQGKTTVPKRNRFATERSAANVWKNLSLFWVSDRKQFQTVWYTSTKKISYISVFISYLFLNYTETHKILLSCVWVSQLSGTLSIIRDMPFSDLNIGSTFVFENNCRVMCICHYTDAIPGLYESFMETKNNVGLRTHPWGTPKVTLLMSLQKI